MVYEEFAPDRQAPLYQANWAGELGQLRQSTLNTLSLVLALSAYAWVLIQGFIMHPQFFWAPMVLPLGVGLLGTLTCLLRRPLVLRCALFVGGSLAVGAAALFWQRSLVAPFVAITAVSAASLVASPAAAFVAAALASGIAVGGALALPGHWPTGVLATAVALYWTIAFLAWLTSRNLYTVLIWALHGYESSWKAMRELQVQRGKLNRTMKALADANALLKRTTYDLAAAREEAERARQLKSQFAANISHELRTPLHLIVGFSQMMYASPESYKGVRWTPELRADIQEIQESAQHLLQLIDDVLDLSSIDAARLPISKERTSLAALLQDAVDTARSLLRGRDLYLRLELPANLPDVYADPTRIRQVLLNLLNNALRFTEQGGITVRALVKADEVEVVVEDTGIGMAAEQLQEVFTEFHQVDASIRRKYGGTGLGLAICKHFVSLHNGRIWAESQIGEGSAFHFTLPLPSSQVVPSQRSQLPTGWRYPAEKPKTPRRLVTLAEPAEFARLLRRYLPDAEVLEGDGAEEAARLARRVQADAVVISADSSSVAIEDTLVRASSDLLLPVIACSLPLERHLALAEGFTHCLMKPFLAEQLLLTIQQAAPQARKVLVVDDDPGVVRLIEHALRTTEPTPEVLAAYDGLEAISLLDEQPDIVLLDLILPRANGLEVLRELKSRPWGKAVPAVAITAYGFEQDVASLGQGFISIRRGKHFTASELTRWLDTTLQVLPARHLVPV